MFIAVEGDVYSQSLRKGNKPKKKVYARILIERSENKISFIL